MSKLSPFDFINSLTTKKYIMVDDEIEKQYIPFVINRGISQSLSDVPYTYKMNLYCDLPKKMQYDYYFHALKAGKRYEKWGKEEKYNKLEYIIQYYKCSKQKAIGIINRLSEDQVNQIERRLTSFGGRK